MTSVQRREKGRLFSGVLKIALVVGVIVVANHAFDLLRDSLNIDIRPSNEDLIHRIITMAALLYVITLAIPFVPGVEIGLGLMAVLGLPIVPLVYFCTITGLFLAYLIGRLIPMQTLESFCHDLRLTRAEDLFRRFNAVPPDEKLSFLLSASPNRATRALLRHRYLALALLINLPGNFLIGGGGGIALIAGATRLFWWPFFLLTVAIAVSPVTLAMLFLGPSILAH